MRAQATRQLPTVMLDLRAAPLRVDPGALGGAPDGGDRCLCQLKASGPKRPHATKPARAR
jgi:hypothetical protein